MRDPWELAKEAASRASVELRPVVSVPECDALLEVMAATWGDQQLVPREMVRALGESGNIPWGAFDGSSLVGFVLGWAGVDDDGLHVHSHMLAARPDRRHSGVGFALKLAQRAVALGQGITVVRWTFDPLVARNAHLNLHKLGAVVDRFTREFYGVMTDELNRGDRSDRFVVRWNLEAEPGPYGAAPGDEPPVLLRRRDDGSPAVRLDDQSEGLVEIPADHAALRASDPSTAAAWRDAIAEVAEACLAGGSLGIAFDRGRSAYVFGRPLPSEVVRHDLR